MMISGRILALLCLSFPIAVRAEARKPNVILLMADDLGWGDTGYNGNQIIRTPHLDEMAAQGLRMDRFYSASAVCSPTRASCLTGRNPYRTGVFSANVGILRPEEITLPEILRNHGYATGHFGKWHLGTLTAETKDANRGKPGNTREFNPPREHGYDTCFATESKVPTWDPMRMPAKFHKGESLKMGWEPLEPDRDSVAYGTRYWNIDGEPATDNLSGDDSRVIMDRVLPFIDRAVEEEKPFFAVVWFHAPHLPCVAGPEYQKLYKDHPLETRNYAGCITALDEQIGRLREHLAKLGISDDTMIWFCSDNGPEGKANGRNGSAGPFRGRKRELLEGGIRVPGLLVWPAKIREARSTSMPCVTSDYLPTVLDAAGIRYPDTKRSIDGISLMPLIEGKMKKRGKPIGFLIAGRFAVQDDDFKILGTGGGKPRLYQLTAGLRETKDLATDQPDAFATRMTWFQSWLTSARDSFDGGEYGSESRERMNQKWPQACERMGR